MSKQHRELARLQARSHQQASRAREADWSVRIPGGRKRETKTSRQSASKAIKKTKSEGQCAVERETAVEREQAEVHVQKNECQTMLATETEGEERQDFNYKADYLTK